MRLVRREISFRGSPRAALVLIRHRKPISAIVAVTPSDPFPKGFLVVRGDSHSGRHFSTLDAARNEIFKVVDDDAERWGILGLAPTTELLK